jgi:hypothetical protein
MQIGAVAIENFRSVQSPSVELAGHSILLGSNNAGKSTILKAIDLFFDAAARITATDHFYSNTKLPIVITIKFINLTPHEVEEFKGAVTEGVMTVSRELSAIDPESGIYSVNALVNPEFAEFRNEKNGTKKRGLFGKLNKQYAGEFGDVSTVDDMQRALLEWEAKTDMKLSSEKVRGFFGAPNVANGKLKKRTNLRLIPAVKETSSEFQDAKKSPILGLLSDIANQIFENRKELTEFIEKARAEAQRLTDPNGIPQLGNISDALTSAVQRFYSETLIEADWIADDPLKVIFPVPRILLSHRKARVPVEYVGHGLQRAVLFAIVQFLAERQSQLPDEAKTVYDAPLSDIIILIEEPEIYQHPIKQRQIYEAFRNIAARFDESTGIRIQIIYTTHSEKLIKLEQFDSVRIVRKVGEGDGIQTTCYSLTLEKCSQLMAAAIDAVTPMQPEAFGAKLHIFNSDVSEGFFAEKIILVEGPTDKAILEGAYKEKGRNAIEEGISIIFMSGKTTVDKPYLIFSELKIPTYLMFDNDRSKKEKRQKPETNILLQKLCKVAEPTEWPEGVFDLFAAMPGNLEDYLISVLSDEYEQLMNDVADEYKMTVDDIKKTPAAVAAVFTTARLKGFEFKYFDEVLAKVDGLSS